MTRSEQPKSFDSILHGVGLAVLLHLVCLPVLAFVVSLLPGSEGMGTQIGAGIVLIGIVQLVYMVPAWIVLWTKGRRRAAKGLAIVAALAVLVNGGCIAMVSMNGLGFH